MSTAYKRFSEKQLSNLRRAFDREASNLLPYRNDFSGKGIVICGGGYRYFPGAWVLIRLLRLFGCRLPIELWLLDHSECHQNFEKWLEPYGVEIVFANERRGIGIKWRVSPGWVLKPYSILNTNEDAF